MPVFIVVYSKRMLYSKQYSVVFGWEIPKHNAFDLIDKKFGKFNGFSSYLYVFKKEPA